MHHPPSPQAPTVHIGLRPPCTLRGAKRLLLDLTARGASDGAGSALIFNNGVRLDLRSRLQ